MTNPWFMLASPLLLFLSLALFDVPPYTAEQRRSMPEKHKWLQTENLKRKRILTALESIDCGEVEQFCF